jgi:hypothetical protein
LGCPGGATGAIRRDPGLLVEVAAKHARPAPAAQLTYRCKKRVRSLQCG